MIDRGLAMAIVQAEHQARDENRWRGIRLELYAAVLVAIGAL